MDEFCTECSLAALPVSACREHALTVLFCLQSAINVKILVNSDEEMCSASTILSFCINVKKRKEKKKKRRKYSDEVDMLKHYHQLCLQFAINIRTQIIRNIVGILQFHYPNLSAVNIRTQSGEGAY